MKGTDVVMKKRHYNSECKKQAERKFACNNEKTYTKQMKARRWRTSITS